MSDEYLWDGSGTPDPDVQQLETLLRPLRSGTPPLDFARLESSSRKRAVWTIRYLAPLVAAAAAIAMMIALSWESTRQASWEVARVAGQPHVGATTLSGTGRMIGGDTLTTDAASRARLNVAAIGEVTVDPDSRVRLVETRDGRHRLALDHGTLRAVITAPPGQFIVSTPSAEATDLGCAYTLHVDEDGAGLLSVAQGWVALDSNGLESFVPAGASCRTDPARGPGTPRYDDGAEELRNALDELDHGDDAARRAQALRLVLDHPDTSAVTLWHLIPRVGAADRGAVVDALADQLAMPRGVTREAILRLDRAALDAWLNELGIGDASWCRQWKGAIPAAR